MGRPKLPTPIWTCESCRTEFGRKRDGKTPRFCSKSCASRATAPRTGGLRWSNGRLYIVCRDGSTVAYYRGVMMAELRRELRPDEHVHHLNHDPADDRPENLVVLSASEHQRLHERERALLRADLKATRPRKPRKKATA